MGTLSAESMDASSGCAKEADQTHCPSRFRLAAPKRIRRSGLVACYAANQALGTIWRGSKEDPDTKEIRNRATLRRVADVGARDVIEANAGDTDGCDPRGGHGMPPPPAAEAAHDV